jgi:hypothetical protein
LIVEASFRVWLEGKAELIILDKIYSFCWLKFLGKGFYFWGFFLFFVFIRILFIIFRTIINFIL